MEQKYPDSIKLVIWDLDETFWKGTLSEEGIEVIPKNIEIVKELTNRGIVNSICSKNNILDVNQALNELGVCDYFVFKKVDWKPKGVAVQNIINEMSLRSVNVVFIDDNYTNLNEVQEMNPGIFVYHPDDILNSLLDLKCAKGKDDYQHSRLNQYKVLEDKVNLKLAGNLDNLSFLKTSDISVFIDYNVESHMERIVELINRSNQLNFTKKRLEDEDSLKLFKDKLGSFGVSSGCVFVKDRFGDYGLVGFFLMESSHLGRKLQHFVFSCRIMNMGVEQYVFSALGEPTINIVEPVSYGLDVFDDINFIKSSASLTGQETLNENKKLGKVLLLGDCQLLQTSTYLGGGVREYVNTVKNDFMVKTDCPGLILSNPSLVTSSEVIEKLPVWDKKMFFELHEDIITADTIVLSIPGVLSGHYVETNDGLICRIIIPSFEAISKSESYLFDEKIIVEKKFNLDERTAFLEDCFDFILRNKKENSKVFVLNQNLDDTFDKHQQVWRTRYNDVCKRVTREYSDFYLLDLSLIVSKTDFVDSDHMTRVGYLNIANEIISKI